MKTDMTQGKILPVLLKFTLPILIGDLFQQLYNIVDTIIVGRTLGAASLAAVGSTGTIMFLIVGVASTLAHGFAVVTSQRFGAHDEVGVRKSFGGGMFLLGGISVLITLLCLIGMRGILSLMNTPEDIFEEAYQYISVIFIGLLATSFYNYFAANLRAIGNSKTPLYFLILASVLNIVLDIVFIRAFGWGVAGAAGATIFSQLISALLCLIYILKQGNDLLPKKNEWKPDREIIRAQFSIGIPMALQNAITASGTMVMQSAANIFGSMAVAANTASMKCRSLFTQPMLSMGQSVATFAGQNYGHGDISRVRKGTFLVMKIMTAYSLVAAVLVNILLPLELRLFISNTSEIVEMMPWAHTYILLSSIFFVPLSYIFFFRSALQGCGKSVFAMSAGILELACRIVFAFLAIRMRSYPMSCLCDSAAWLAAGIYTCVAFHLITKKMLEEKAVVE